MSSSCSAALALASAGSKLGLAGLGFICSMGDLERGTRSFLQKCIQPSRIPTFVLGCVMTMAWASTGLEPRSGSGSVHFPGRVD
uniref:Putative secreted protein n=1 Tax=Ixodes ricinus TaxID=34613 RepID=A0A6B0U7R7_IXORI